MPQILLVNPRSRRKTTRRKTTRKKPMARKKRRTAAQKRATAKMIAANRRRSRSRRKNPVKRKVARKRPTRRRKTTATRRRRRVTRRRNPSLSMRSVQNQFIEAGTGALGALGLDVVQGYLPIPANLKGGIVGTGVKALLAIGLGVVASKTKLVSNANAAKMANGALVVVLHDELKKQVTNFAPGLQLGEYLDSDGMGYYGSGWNPVDDPDALGTYLPELTTEGLDMHEDGFSEYLDDFNYTS